jgi:hypothetical protein
MLCYNVLVTSGPRAAQRAAGHNANAQLTAHGHQITLKVPAQLADVWSRFNNHVVGVFRHIKSCPLH